MVAETKEVKQEVKKEVKKEVKQVKESAVDFQNRARKESVEAYRKNVAPLANKKATVHTVR